MALVSLSNPNKEVKDYRYFTVDKLYLIKPTKSFHVTLGERSEGKYLELDLNDLKKLHDFIRSILLNIFSETSTTLISKSINLGREPKIYFTYIHKDKQLQVGIYDEKNMATLDIKDIIEFKLFLSNNISKLSFLDDLPF